MSIILPTHANEFRSRTYAGHRFIPTTAYGQKVVFLTRALENQNDHDLLQSKDNCHVRYVRIVYRLPVFARYVKAPDTLLHGQRIRSKQGPDNKFPRLNRAVAGTTRTRRKMLDRQFFHRLPMGRNIFTGSKPVGYQQ